MDTGVADVVEMIDVVTEALVVAVLEADEDVWVERIGVGDAVEVDEEAPLMTKNPVLDISWELELYTELRSLNRRTYFASLLRTLVGIVIVQSYVPLLFVFKFSENWRDNESVRRTNCTLSLGSYNGCSYL